ncbi:response regulator transcription factor [Brevundimonas diminuta]|uniref:response regulator transcription factor n=1 Tax=Brevundimonas TaxID=41275 RepID=UPI0019084F87|nr:MULTISPECIES: response regulator transcription factor [Brevundimonas]MBK1968109.1 response regulator transcription factor [Brevundimonas diminuta]MBK1974759.1 response regulator transcription factor [Brevundimonas diminuta]MDA0743301.1 response regulator transcription factor [Pseudomonadota bacterium]MDA1322468.1 response regulator transcription factor [Pseudomonadota bacterium]
MAIMQRTVLVVDDDPHIRDLLTFALGKAGLATREAGDGEAALAAIAERSPDLVILDINMPRMDGIEVCRRIRAQGPLPVLFLSSRDDEIDRILGIELGADDYVVKPFSPREVVARVAAILRRVNLSPPPPPPGGVRIGRLSLDTDGWRTRWDDLEVSLTLTEFGIVKMLASAPRMVFTRDAIIDRIHGPGFALTDRTIDSHVRNLRAKFAALGAADVIETRAGVGYQMGPCRGGSA